MAKDRNEEITEEVIAFTDEIDLFNRIKCSFPGEVCERQVYILTIAYIREGIMGVSGTCIPHISNLAKVITASEGKFVATKK